MFYSNVRKVLEKDNKKKKKLKNKVKSIINVFRNKENFMKKYINIINNNYKLQTRIRLL